MSLPSGVPRSGSRLPAVMSVRGVLAALENGEIVTVNGTTGQVVRQN